jgi:hypothetical protein
MALALTTALVGGLVSWLVGEMVYRSYQGDLLPRLNIHPDPEDLRRLQAARVMSTTITFSILGGILAILQGFAGGLVRRSFGAAAEAGSLGLISGAAATAAVAAIVVPVFFKLHDPQASGLLLPLLCHGAIWGSIGAAGGLAFAIGLGDRFLVLKAIAGGIAGALVATVLYEIVGAVGRPSSPDSGNRPEIPGLPVLRRRTAWD